MASSDEEGQSNQTEKNNPGSAEHVNEQRSTSVRGAPAHERAAIRRRQNSESSRRSRERYEELLTRIVERHKQLAEEITALEKRVEVLVELLEESGVVVPPLPRLATVLEESPDDDELFDEMLALLDECGNASASPADTSENANQEWPEEDKNPP